jgi:hypothetical protein
LDTLSDDSGK